MRPVVVVEAPLTRVTVLEDRAQVTRRARVELDPGLHVLRVAETSPLIVDRTLRGELRGPPAPACRLLDVRVRRAHTVRATRPAEERQLAQEIDRLRDQYMERHAARRLAEAEQKATLRSRSELLHVICLEAGRGSERAAAWRPALALVEARERELEAELHDLQRATDDLAERIEQLAERHHLAQQPTSHYRGSLEAAVEVAGGACVAAEISWEYLVPCALWRPTHRAELLDGKLAWTVGASVWQLTGEDWSDVQLALSTARPTLGADLPLLDDDLLRLRTKTESERQAVEVEARDEEIALLSPGSVGVTQAMVPGVDDGGAVRTFQLRDRVSVVSDGRTHLLELDRFEAKAELDLVCTPELVPAAMLRSRTVNASRAPLLAGPVALVRDGGFVGRSLTGFVAPGEHLALGWGSEDEIQVVRQVDHHQEEASFGRRARTRRWVRNYLSNTASEPRVVTVTERVPVSELEDVRVRLLEKESSPGHRVDDKGHVSWTVELAGGGKAELVLVCDVESSKRVVWRS